MKKVLAWAIAIVLFLWVAQPKTAGYEPDLSDTGIDNNAVGDNGNDTLTSPTVDDGERDAGDRLNEERDAAVEGESGDKDEVKEVGHEEQVD